MLRNAGLRRSVKVLKMSCMAPLALGDDGCVGDADGMEFPFELAGPEIEEFVEDREAGSHVQILPNIGLQQAGMVRQMVEDFGGGKAVAGELLI